VTDDPLAHIEDEAAALAESIRLDARFRREIRETLAEIRATQAQHSGALATILARLPREHQ
jgi:hypothetical protein